MKPIKTLFIALGAALTITRPVAASSASLTFSAPTNNVPMTVLVQITPPGGSPINVGALINPGMTVQAKRNTVVQTLNQIGYQATPDANPAKCTINNLANGTTVSLIDQGTGEVMDQVQTVGPTSGTVAYPGTFNAFNYLHQPAIFTAGIITDLGVLSDQVSASELNFQTDGPIICQALFQRLAPRAPQYGAQINYAGDRLEIYFDPAFTVTQGGIIFGTNSTTPGDTGTIVLPTPGFPIIPQGNDFWSIDKTPSLQFGGPDIAPIPADFFFPGSQPFIGSVLFGGKAIDPVAGSADTIVQRMTSCNLPSIGVSATVPIEIVALELRSVDPIVIGPTEWKVRVSIPSSQPSGSMTITRGSATGGTFTSDLLVHPVFVFTPIAGGSDLTWDSGATIHITSTGSGNWCSSPGSFYQAGGGPSFFPCSTVQMTCSGSAMTQEPALNNGIPVNCPPLDANGDGRFDGRDLQIMVAAYLQGPTHPNFCAIDLNSNGQADPEDIDLFVNTLLTLWETVITMPAPWVNVSDTSCDFKHHVLVGCQWYDGPNIAVRAADKDGNPSGCPVKFRLYNCDGVGTGEATEIEPGDSQCVTVPSYLGRQLQVWCKSTGDSCRISMKHVSSCN